MPGASRDITPVMVAGRQLATHASDLQGGTAPRNAKECWGSVDVVDGLHGMSWGINTCECGENNVRGVEAITESSWLGLMRRVQMKSRVDPQKQPISPDWCQAVGRILTLWSFELDKKYGTERVCSFQ